MEAVEDPCVTRCGAAVVDHDILPTTSLQFDFIDLIFDRADENSGSGRGPVDDALDPLGGQRLAWLG